MSIKKLQKTVLLNTEVVQKFGQFQSFTLKKTLLPSTMSLLLKSSLAIFIPINFDSIRLKFTQPVGIPEPGISNPRTGIKMNLSKFLQAETLPPTYKR